MIAFRSRRIGEGNTSGRIAATETIRDKLLHDKNERRTMSFSAFLDKLQNMFMIFEEENEVITEQPGHSLVLLKKVEHPPLQDLIGALVQHVRTTIRRFTFTECANHRSAQVLESPDQHMPRKVSGTGPMDALPPHKVTQRGSKG